MWNGLETQSPPAVCVCRTLQPDMDCGQEGRGGVAHLMSAGPPLETGGWESRGERAWREAEGEGGRGGGREGEGGGMEQGVIIQAKDLPLLQ